MREEKDYITGIRRGREIERHTNKTRILIAWMLGLAFGITLGIIIGAVLAFTR
jgi:hypothetical protein